MNFEVCTLKYGQPANRLHIELNYSLLCCLLICQHEMSTKVPINAGPLREFASRLPFK